MPDVRETLCFLYLKAQTLGLRQINWNHCYLDSALMARELQMRGYLMIFCKPD